MVKRYKIMKYLMLIAKSKIEVPGMFETQKVRRHDKFRKEWSQH